MPQTQFNSSIPFTQKYISGPAYADNAYAYHGEAIVGSAVSSPVWRVKRVERLTGVETWADGNGNYDNVFTSHAVVAALNYSSASYDAYGKSDLIRSVLRFCLSGRDASGSFTDLSDNVATATVDAGNTGAFATVNYMASVAAVNVGLTVPNAKVLWNPRTESLVMAFVVKRAVPVAAEVVCAWSGGVSASQTGFYVSHRSSTGALKIVPTIAGVVVNAQADSTLAFSDGTPQDRHCTIAFDSDTGIFSIYRDGVLSNSFTGTPMVGASLYPNANITHEYRIGGTAGGASVTTVATATYGHQGYVFAGALPAHIGRIAAFLAETARVPLNSSTFGGA